ncbi:MAG: ribonuclease H-like domain-containing protein [Vicinamibacterales bacterium]
MASSLSDRLRQVVGAVPAVAPDAREPAAPPAVPAAPPAERLAGAAERLGGRVHERREGAVIVVDRDYPADTHHGREPIARTLEALSEELDALGVFARVWPGAAGLADLGPACPPAFCFFDLETTGLAGGAGTQAFLVGCAVVDGDGIHVRQFLLPGFEHERALLAEVSEWSGCWNTLVTFNGRTFDVPLIETRYLFHRLAFTLGDRPHLDMLHAARRLWRQRPSVLGPFGGPRTDEESCKLTVLEKYLAGVHRVGDVPGFEIPSRYFQFVRDGDARPLEAVLEHNRLDLVSLAVLTARALRLVSRGASAGPDPMECLGLGRLYERAGRSEDAEACFAHAARLARHLGRGHATTAGDALRRLAVVRRRAGRLAAATEAWQEIMSLPGCPSAFRREAREALAIHHEHRSKDLEEARRLVLDVLADGAAGAAREAAAYRLERIERKLSVRSKGGLMAALEDDETPAEAGG